MWLFYYLVRNKINAALIARLTAKVDRPKSKDGKFTSYIEVVNYLLRTYETDEVISGSDADLK